MDLQARVERLEALEHIRAVVNRMRRASDQKNDPAIIQEIMTEDCQWRTKGAKQLLGGERSVEGRAAIIEESTAIARTILAASWHHTSPVEVQLSDDGKSANARWYLFELARLHPGQGPSVSVTGGWYDAVFILQNDNWLIKDITLELHFTGAAPANWIYRNDT